MPWVRLDESFPEHPKVVQAGPLAGWLHVSAIAWCNRQLTDGFVPCAQLRKLVDFDGIYTDMEGGASGIDTPDPKALADALVSHGLWEEVEGGWQIHDFLEYQPSRESILAKRQKEHEAKSKAGRRRVSTADRDDRGRFRRAGDGDGGDDGGGGGSPPGWAVGEDDQHETAGHVQQIHQPDEQENQQSASAPTSTSASLQPSGHQPRSRFRPRSPKYELQQQGLGNYGVGDVEGAAALDHTPDPEPDFDTEALAEDLRAALGDLGWREAVWAAEGWPDDCRAWAASPKVREAQNPAGMFVAGLREGWYTRYLGRSGTVVPMPDRTGDKLVEIENWRSQRSDPEHASEAIGEMLDRIRGRA